MAEYEVAKESSSSEKPDSLEPQRQKLRDILVEYLGEAKDVAKEWQDKASDAWDMIHGRIDFSYKSDDQSKLHMNRVGRAQEQIKAQLKQGLVNFDEWLVVESEKGFESPIMSTEEAKRLVWLGIDSTHPRSKISENLGIATVENVLATKLQPKICEKRAPGGRKVKTLEIEHIILNIRNYYRDPFGKLYEFMEVEQDKHELLAMAADKPSREKPYRLEAVKKLQPSKKMDSTEESQDKGSDTEPSRMARRKTCVIQEFWGTVLDDEGEVFCWYDENGKKLECKDVLITMANSEVIIRDPEPIATWDSESLFVSTRLLHTNENAYGRSLLAPGVDMNRAEDELINAGIDSALKEAMNINVLKLHGLADKTQASGGVRYGTTLLQNAQLLPGEKLLDTVTTGQVPQGLLAILGIVKSAGAENLNLNEIALSGNLPNKQVRSTEVNAATATIQGLFEAICSDLEDEYIARYARKVFLLMLQYSDFLSDQDLKYVFYGRGDRILAFQQLSARERYDELANSFLFRGKGLRGIAHNARQAQMLQNIFSMIAANPVILDAFERRGFDPVALFEEIIRGMGLDMLKFLNADAAVLANVRQLIREKVTAEAAAAAATPTQPGQGAPAGQAQGMINAPMQGEPSAMPSGAGNEGFGL